MSVATHCIPWNADCLICNPLGEHDEWPYGRNDGEDGDSALPMPDAPGDEMREVGLIELLRRYESAIIDRVNEAHVSIDSREYGRLAGVTDVLRSQLRARLAPATDTPAETRDDARVLFDHEPAIAAAFDAIHSWRLSADLTAGQDRALLALLTSLRKSIARPIAGWVEMTITARKRRDEADAQLEAAEQHVKILRDQLAALSVPVQGEP